MTNRVVTMQMTNIMLTSNTCSLSASLVRTLGARTVLLEL